ncbi:MAG: hypothetical protein A2W31_13655 [Planctomycetes bacterium RBG_16_64_10]|nr:MAG: hypothetical protein A2W31_13655 [Planctomycetes bacterium RBG_16_64_10]
MSTHSIVAVLLATVLAICTGCQDPQLLEQLRGEKATVQGKLDQALDRADEIEAKLLSELDAAKKAAEQAVGDAKANASKELEAVKADAAKSLATLQAQLDAGREEANQKASAAQQQADAATKTVADLEKQLEEANAKNAELEAKLKAVEADQEKPATS